MNIINDCIFYFKFSIPSRPKRIQERKERFVSKFTCRHNLLRQFGIYFLVKIVYFFFFIYLLHERPQNFAVWGSAVSSPSEVRSGSPAQIDFFVVHFWPVDDYGWLRFLTLISCVYGKIWGQLALASQSQIWRMRPASTRSPSEYEQHTIRLQYTIMK